jgi:hypothetical protein
MTHRLMVFLSMDGADDALDDSPMLNFILFSISSVASSNGPHASPPVRFILLGRIRPLFGLTLFLVLTCRVTQYRRTSL